MSYKNVDPLPHTLSCHHTLNQYQRRNFKQANPLSNESERYPSQTLNMDNIIKEGEQMVDGGGSNQQQGNDQSQQQSSGGNSGSSGGGFVSNTEDAYINQGEHNALQ